MSDPEEDELAAPGAGGDQGAPRSGLEGLLVVQGHDTRIDQLQHRHDTLSERDRLARLGAELRQVDHELAGVTEEHAGLTREQRRLEDEVSAIEDKRLAVDKALYGGSVTNPRELQAMQDEIESLGRRRSRLEDQVLELMERIEPLDSQLADLRAASEAGAAEVVAVAADLQVAETELRQALADEGRARASAVADVPPELVEEYDQLRRRSGGVGIARLIGSQCGGCHLTLSAVELARIKRLPAGTIVHCDECGRMLAR